MGEWEDYGIWQYYTIDQLKEQTMQAGKLDKPEFGIRYAVQWREQTGIEVWMDHWEPDYWKNSDWSDEQNLVYTEFFLDTLQTLGIASSGPQTRRIWDNENGRFFQDDFTQAFIKILKEHNWRSTVSVKEMNNAKQQPLGFKLNQNYPNPFNPVTTIEFSIMKRGPVRLTIYNQLGQKVATLVDKNMRIGNYSIKWDAFDLPSGFYFLNMQSKDQKISQKMILIK